MNWEQIQGKWQEYKGQVKQRWGKLTDNDLTSIQGKREALAGKLLASYGSTKEQIEKEIGEFEASVKATGAVKSDAGKHDAVKHDAARPDAVKHDAARPEVVKPAVVKAEAGKPDAWRHDVARSKVEGTGGSGDI